MKRIWNFVYLLPGWNDGTLSQLQIDWSEQEVIPGDFTPGKDSTFEVDPYGIQCYECANCKKDYFDTSDIGVSSREGCYVCIKEWLQGAVAISWSYVAVHSKFQSRC